MLVAFVIAARFRDVVGTSSRSGLGMASVAAPLHPEAARSRHVVGPQPQRTHGRISVKRIFLATALALPLAFPALSAAATGPPGSGVAPTATSSDCTAASKQSDMRGTQAQGVQPSATGGGNGGLLKQGVQQLTADAGNAGPGKQAPSGPLTPCG